MIRPFAATLLVLLGAVVHSGCGDGAIGAAGGPEGPSPVRGAPTTTDAGATTDAEPTTDAATPSDDAAPDAPVVATVDEAVIVTTEVPATLACAAAATARITVRNTGTTTWTRAAGYKLGAVGDADDLSRGATRIELGEGSVLAPGATVVFEIPLRAPETAGTFVTDWQMVRDSVRWFGAISTTPVSVTCAPVEAPDRMDVVNAVAAKYGHLLDTNTYESCGEFVQRVLAALGDAEWGHVAKTAGEAQCTPAGFTPRSIDGHTVTGFSHDAIYHRATNRQVDILGNAAANSDPRPEIWGRARVQWGTVAPEHYRKNNPWMAPVALP